MPADFGGKWILSEFDNYEAFIDDMKVAGPIKQFLMMPKAELEIDQTGDMIKYKRKRGDDVLELVFTVGKTFTENAYGHKEVRIGHWDGDKLVVKAAEGENHWTSTVELVNGRLVATDVSAGGVTGKRVFDKA